MADHKPGGSGLSFSLDSTTDTAVPNKSTNDAVHIADIGAPTSDQGADVAVSTTALSGGAGVQAIPTGTTHIRFQLKPAVLATTAWVNIKFGTVSVIVIVSTGTTLAAGEGPFIVPVPSGATHFDAIAGAALTLNWTPA